MELHRPEGRTQSSELDRMVENAQRASDFLKALAHESRLMILCILAESEKSVSELEDLLNLRQPTVSQQLARLRADGLVSTRRNGKTIYYNLASEEVRIVIGAIYDVFCRKARQRVTKRPGRPELRMRARAPAHRISLHRKPDSPERADSAGHVLCRGYEEPAFARSRVRKRFCESSIFGGVAGTRLQQNATSRQAEIIKHLIDELRFRQLISEQARIAAGIYDSRLRIGARKLAQANDTVAIAADHRFAKLTRQPGLDRAAQYDNAVRRASI